MDNAASIDIDMVCRRYSGMIRARLSRFFPGHDIDDLFQDVLLRVIEKQHTFQGRSCVSTWLYQITTRFALNRIQRNKRRQELWHHTGDLAWAAPTTRPDQESKVLLKELSSQKDQELFHIGVQYHLNGLSQGEIATLVGCSRQRISLRLQSFGAAA